MCNKEQNGGLAIAGYPFSEPLLMVNGRQAQWFERARLEYWPEYAGTSAIIQMGLLGREHFDILMSEQLLYGSNIIAIRERGRHTPAPVTRGVAILASQGVRQGDRAVYP